MRQQHRNLVEQPDWIGDPAKLGVLVADDEQMIRLLVQLGLERNGFTVWLAADGREAIDLYRAHSADISAVLLDVQMPDVDGPQTLDALRELSPTLPVCFMSGDTGTYQAEELVRRGAAFVIAKPFRMDDVAKILRLLASGAAADHLTASTKYAKANF
jgi:CheY-like chemotaxis protein